MPYIITTRNTGQRRRDYHVGAESVGYYIKSRITGRVMHDHLDADEAEQRLDAMLKVSRRAVATLDEARQAVFYAVTDATMENVFDLDAIVTEQGGTVGPLPDGTVIEVERVEWAGLADSIVRTRPHALPLVPGSTEILAAYNAAQ